MNLKRSFHHHFAIFILLSLIALAQLAWWMIFQINEGARISHIQNDIWNQQISLARGHAAMSDSEPLAKRAEWLASAFPDLALSSDGKTVAVNEQALHRLHHMAHARVRMFISEGVFFSILLLIGIGYMYWVLRQEILHERQQTAFLSATSHELKTPITSLRLYLDTLIDRDLSKPQAVDLMNTMRLDLNRLTDQIDRMLQAQAFMLGKRKAALQRVNLTDETQIVLNEVFGRFDLKGFQFRTHLEPNVTVMAIPDQWQILVSNLLENAFKYSPNGGALEISLVRGDTNARLCISDQGVGFDPAEGQRIFERFYRVGDEDRRRVRGTGLGLYLVREIAHSFGGSVRAESEGEGKGAAFIVELPLAQEASNA